MIIYMVCLVTKRHGRARTGTDPATPKGYAVTGIEGRRFGAAEIASVSARPRNDEMEMDRNDRNGIGIIGNPPVPVCPHTPTRGARSRGRVPKLND